MIDSETIKLIGQEKIYRVESGLGFVVKVDKIREVYGRVQALIVPVNGRGSKWVIAENLQNI